jgi:hypothetical protein
MAKQGVTKFLCLDCVLSPSKVWYPIHLGTCRMLLLAAPREVDSLEWGFHAHLWMKLTTRKHDAPFRLLVFYSNVFGLTRKVCPVRMESSTSPDCLHAEFICVVEMSHALCSLAV